MLDPDWLPARELRKRLISAGVAVPALAVVVAWACRRKGLAAVGFGRVHQGGEVIRELDRAHVDQRVWRVFSADDKPELDRFIRWDEGEFTWIISRTDEPEIQETWTSVHFDRVSADAIIWEIRERAATDALQDWEIDAWLATECQASDVKKAWKQFSADVGTSRRGKWTTFERRWKEKTGHRGPGKPRRTAVQ